MRGLAVAVVDVLEQLGGQVTGLYPEKLIYHVAALPSVTGRELIASQYRAAAQLGRNCETTGT